MAGEAYDYMIGILIVGMVFTSAVLVVPNLSYVNLLYVDQQQLRNVALDVFKVILLDTGYPINWGSNANFDPNSTEDIQRFGLASSTAGSFYVLDPIKVQRLDLEEQGPNWNCIEYNKVHDLLGLNGYGFSFQISPMFNVTIFDKYFDFTGQPSISCKVKVLRNDERPLANAAVSATIIYSSVDQATGKVSIGAKTATTVFTDLLGTCEINETLPPGGKIKDATVVVKVSVADIVNLSYIYSSFTALKEIIKIDYGEGDNVTLSVPEEGYPFDQPNEADWIINLSGYYGDGDLSELYSGGTANSDKLTWGGGYKTWSRDIPGIRSSDPTLVIFTLSCVPKDDQGKAQGRQPLLIVSPGPHQISPKGLHFSGKPPQGTAVNLQRTVIISDIPYIAEITLWKESI